MGFQITGDPAADKVLDDSAFALLADPAFGLHRVTHVTAGLDGAAALVAAMAGEAPGERPVHGVIVPNE